MIKAAIALSPSSWGMWVSGFRPTGMLPFLSILPVVGGELVSPRQRCYPNGRAATAWARPLVASGVGGISRRPCSSQLHPALTGQMGRPGGPTLPFASSAVFWYFTSFNPQPATYNSSSPFAEIRVIRGFTLPTHNPHPGRSLSPPPNARYVGHWKNSPVCVVGRPFPPPGAVPGPRVG